jgi:oxygen-independent coproporphyrinogen-3 oxidase
MIRCHSLYVHVPFCRKKCAYCDFNSYVRQEHIIPAYVDALLGEATLWTESEYAGRIETLYFGGGTPSLLPIAAVERLIDGLRKRFDFAPDTEVTAEVNPESVDAAYLADLRRLSVNRLSLGVQSLDDAELRFLGRIHDAAQAQMAYRAAREAAFDSVSIDLIFGLPGQTLSQWRHMLDNAIALGPDHLSLYALTVEGGTPLGRRIARGQCAEPDPDVQADIYAWSGERLAETGYEQYEISNWARPGYRCRHNLTYWRSEPYLGLGAGAHSYVGGCRLANERRPGRYIESIRAFDSGQPFHPAKLRHVESVELSDAEREMSDAVILGLRLTEGVSLAAMRDRFGVDPGERYAHEIRDLEELGLLESADGRIRLTARGRLLGNEAFQRFLP